MSRKTITISIVILLAVISLGAATFFYISPKPNIRVVTSPQSSIIKIGEKQIEQGKQHYIKKGTYQLSIEAKDFTSVKKEIVIGDDLQTLSFCLTPNGKTPEQYIEENPQDRLICEAAGGQEYNEFTKKVIEEYPILEQLPYEDGTFIIGQGRDDETGDIVLTVHYSTEKSKQEAVEWINKTATGTPLPALVYTQDYVQTDRVGGKDSQLDTELKRKYPIITSLPLDLYIFKIGYRIDRSDSSGKSIKLTIDSDTVTGRIDAIRHIRTLGYNPTDYKIEFINYQERNLR